MFLFVFADGDPAVPDDLQRQKMLLRERFASSGWECPEILHALGSASELYMDRVSQIQVPRWTQGRTALVGDAAFCISLLGGQGSALAMVAAYILAGELKRAGGDHVAAFPRYQARLGAFIAGKQDAARKFTSFFAPRSRFGIFIGNQAMKLMSIPFMAELVAGRELRDTIELPEY